jgi:hypothetical protein
MRQTTIRWVCALSLGFLGLSAGRAHAQIGPFGGMAGTSPASSSPTTSTSGQPYAGAMGYNPYLNPMTNPYMNPLLNPGMLGGPSTGNGQAVMGLYMMNSLQNGNGIGSGKLGGPNATLPGRVTRGKAAKTPAAEQSINTSNQPGGGAGRYFGRSNVSTTGASRFYNRQVQR